MEHNSSISWTLTQTSVELTSGVIAKFTSDMARKAFKWKAKLASDSIFYIGRIDT